MTQERKMRQIAEREMQRIVEATGGIWHDNLYQTSNNCIQGCGDVYKTGCRSNNPSPHSLDDLVKLAEKNGFDTIMFDKYLTHSNSCDLVHNSVPVQVGSTKADALRSALVKAVEGITS